MTIENEFHIATMLIKTYLRFPTWCKYGNLLSPGFKTVNGVTIYFPNDWENLIKSENHYYPGKRT